MNLARHYQTLGLRPGSSVCEVKAAYRRLVRRYHPDVNPKKKAVEHFIEINDAYTAIAEAQQATSQRTPSYSTQAAQAASISLDNFYLKRFKRQLEKLGIGNFSAHRHRPSPNPDNTAKHPETDPTRRKSDTQDRKAETPSFTLEQNREDDLKQTAYLQLKALLKQKKYPRAIALVEGLAHRMPTDSEVSQWQAIVYQRWGRQLIRLGQTPKAQIYLRKALRTDPHNPSLWREVNRDFGQIAHLGHHATNSSSHAI